MGTLINYNTPVPAFGQQPGNRGATESGTNNKMFANCVSHVVIPISRLVPSSE
jgi:hypothetical protein